jgi:hypothetical protein
MALHFVESTTLELVARVRISIRGAPRLREELKPAVRSTCLSPRTDNKRDTLFFTPNEYM